MLINEPSKLNADCETDGNESRDKRSKPGAHQWQWDANDGQKPEFHPDIYEDLEHQPTNNCHND